MDLKDLSLVLGDDKVSEETKSLISSLPSHTDFHGDKLCKYEGCWYYHNILQGVLNFKRYFQPQDTDIILASYPKSGTTWLKALTIALLERSKNQSSVDYHHPLLSNNPHGIVPFLEILMHTESSSPDRAKFSSHSGLFSTHMPLHTMQETIKNSRCKVVYISRNVKDSLVSCWFFMCSIFKVEPSTSILESIFKSFCDGTIGFVPVWDHILSYWRGSLENPENILFMKYEEIKQEPHVQIKRLAEFLGCPFTKEEEESGLVDEILGLCSLRNLSGLEVNKTGKLKTNVDHKHFFRKGEVDDWKNYLTLEMENKIDMITEKKLDGSGLKL